MSTSTSEADATAAAPRRPSATVVKVRILVVLWEKNRTLKEGELASE